MPFLSIFPASDRGCWSGSSLGLALGEVRSPLHRGLGSLRYLRTPSGIPRVRALWGRGGTRGTTSSWTGLWTFLCRHFAPFVRQRSHLRRSWLPIWLRCGMSPLLRSCVAILKPRFGFLAGLLQVFVAKPLVLWKLVCLTPCTWMMMLKAPSLPLWSPGASNWELPGMVTAQGLRPVSLTRGVVTEASSFREITV